VGYSSSTVLFLTVTDLSYICLELCIMTSTFEIQPIGRFVGQSAPVKRPRVRSGGSSSGSAGGSALATPLFGWIK
jgi:hypothetical protein